MGFRTRHMNLERIDHQGMYLSVCFLSQTPRKNKNYVFSSPTVPCIYFKIPTRFGNIT